MSKNTTTSPTKIVNNSQVENPWSCTKQTQMVRHQMEGIKKKGQDKLRPSSLSFYIRNFKHDRNHDFDITLSNTFFVEGMMDETLPANKRPKYCCGENPFYDPDGVLLVNNEDSFNGWFNSDGSCSNYLSTYTVEIEQWDESNFATGMVDDFNPFDGTGFNNATEFPEYAFDTYNQLFCYELHFTAIANQFGSTFAVRSPRETWVYVNNHLYIDQGGYTDGYADFPKVVFGTIDPQLQFGVEYPIDVYSCSREVPTRGDELFFELYGYELDIFCSWIDDNGVCNGENFNLVCADNTNTCTQSVSKCGFCETSNRTCDDIPITICTYPVCLEGSGCIVENVICDDFDPCTVDSCDETFGGCINIDTPNCRCNTTNCVTNDECFPKICLGDDTCAEILRDCSLELPECLSPSCENGNCICLDPVTTTTTGVSTTTTTTTGVSTTTTTGVSTTTTTTTTTGVSTTTTGVSTISTISTTGIPSTITTTSNPTTTITSSTTGTTTGTTSTISTRPPIDESKCNKNSCPHGYHCIQLFKSFTCVSEHFSCDVTIKYYNEPLPTDYVPDLYGNCRLTYSLLIKSDIQIQSMSLGPSNEVVIKSFGNYKSNKTIITIEVSANTTTKSTQFTISVTDVNYKTFNFFRVAYCIETNEYGPITDYLLEPKNKQIFSNEIISKNFNTGVINGSPKIVLEYSSNSPPPLLKSMLNGIFESTVRLLGNKRTSKLYELSIYQKYPSYYFSDQNISYSFGNIEINGFPATSLSFENGFQAFYPSIQPSTSAIGIFNFGLNNSSNKILKISSENSFVYPALSNGSNVTYINYLNEGGNFSAYMSFGSVSVLLINGFYNIKAENYSGGIEMKLLFQDSLTNTHPTSFTAVFSKVPWLPQYPMLLTYPNGLKRELWFNQYPFSIKNGFRNGLEDDYQIVFTAKFSKYSSGQYVYSYNSTSTLHVDIPLSANLSLVDTKPPEIVAIQFYYIGMMKIDIHITILDDISGFSAFVCLDTNEIIFDYKNLMLGGTINNGTYSFIYDCGFTAICQKSAFLDFAGNSLKQNQSFLDLIISNNGNSPEYLSIDPSLYKAKTLSDFQEFYFAYNNINLTKKGFYNTLFFNFKDGSNDTDYCIKFRLAISSGWPNPIDYYSKWDSDLQIYRVDFYLPSNLLALDILYYIYLGADIETEYSTSHFQSWVDPIGAKLSVFSDIGDMMPPLVQSVSFLLNSSVLIGGNLTINLVIEDQYNGFDFGEIRIIGSVDFIPWIFILNSENKNPLLDNYTIKIFIPPNQRTQTYYISYMKLSDKNGIFSEYTFGKQQVFPIIDPLVKINSESRSYTVNGDDNSNSSKTLPSLVGFDFTPKLMDVGGSDSARTANFTIKVKETRTDLKPTIYLGDTYLNYVSVPVIQDGLFDLVTNITTFTVSTIVPYGFGFPEGILLSVFGIQSSHTTFQGYSSLDLDFISFPFSIDTPTFSITTKLLSYSPISTNGGQLTIFGRSLDAVNNPSYQISLSTNEKLLNISHSTISGSVVLLSIPTLKSKLPFLVELITPSKIVVDSILVYPYYNFWNSTPTPTPTPTQPTTNPPQKCGGNPQCGGESKGKCVDGVGCVCISPWIGSECQSRVITIPPPVINPINPNQNLTLNSTGTNEFTLVSLVSLISLRELNFKNELVRSFRFDKWKLISNTSTNSNYITDVIDPINNNTICSVNVSTIWYQTLTDIEFAGQNLTMNPSTLKYNINITSFPFTNNLNTLQLVMSATAQSTSPQENTCSSNEFGETTSNENSNYLQLSVNEHSLYGRFIKRGIVDNIIRTIGNEVLKDLSSENSYYISQSYIGINIPHYKEYIQLDPDFSVLLDQSSASSICNDKGNKLSKGAIIGIAIGCAAFTIIVVTLLALLLKNKYFFKSMELKVIKLVKKKNTK
ncbi:hypothetical protein RB653_008465 [Dictyostelium firmibasis]|uniref:EGF-like domain-containing protein n=1 Tax=Dictyostelium firmibasis TaxID=79012 RepID=A0AAN7TR40_9MYCE